ncbi:box H/ACA snoRNP assembly protein Shq1 [Pelomyxa schiedti]|nr:box H/ACA snoRNP assembly protein Shq1 [Pelomyxa schiedti]
MLTPRFSVTQDEQYIIITMKIPGYLKLGEEDIVITEKLFKFHAHPYFLSLTFPCEVTDDGSQKATFDRVAGQLVVWVPKAVRGEFFPRLDMVTSLLTPRVAKLAPKIEVVGGDASCATEAMEGVAQPEEHTEGEPDWSFEQSIPEEESLNVLACKPQYGFNNCYSNFFQPLQEDIKELLDLLEPDSTTVSNRRTLRIEQENAKFEEQQDHYMVDFIDDEEIEKHLAFEPQWCVEHSRICKHATASTTPPISVCTESFASLSLEQRAVLNPATLVQAILDRTSITTQPTPENATTAPTLTTTQTTPQSTPTSQIDTSDTKEPLSQTTNTEFTTKMSAHQAEVDLIQMPPEYIQTLLSLPRKEYLISNTQELLNGLLQIMYSYCYDVRTTHDETTVESAWTISKLTPLLAWLDTPQNTRDALVGCYRRALTFPLYRHWDLTVRVAQDAVIIFKLGPRAIVRSLIAVKKIMETHEFRHYLNNLFIDDYCVWVQTLSRDQFLPFAREIEQAISSIHKADTGFPLESLEKKAVTIAMAEDEGAPQCDDTENGRPQQL